MGNSRLLVASLVALLFCEFVLESPATERRRQREEKVLILSGGGESSLVAWDVWKLLNVVLRKGTFSFLRELDHGDVKTPAWLTPP